MKEYKFDAKKTTEDLIRFIRYWFDMNGKGCKAVIGISGGKDSSVVAALCVRALGKERVVGVMMPDGVQADIQDSKDLIEFLGIEGMTINIGRATESLLGEILDKNTILTEQTSVNLPARMRMVALYGISQSCNGRVVGTANLSESYIGWNTRWDLSNCNDLNPIAGITATEVKAVGRVLGLPDRLVDKVPSDGLCGSTDEEKLGFKYEDLDSYLRTGCCYSMDAKKKIDAMHGKNAFKLRFADWFKPEYTVMV